MLATRGIRFWLAALGAFPLIRVDFDLANRPAREECEFSTPTASAKTYSYSNVVEIMDSNSQEAF